MQIGLYCTRTRREALRFRRVLGFEARAAQQGGGGRQAPGGRRQVDFTDECPSASRFRTADHKHCSKRRPKTATVPGLENLARTSRKQCTKTANPAENLAGQLPQ